MVKKSTWLIAGLTLVASATSVQAQPAPDKTATPVRLFPFHEGGKGGKWGYINRHGRVVVPPRFVDAHDFVDGLARVQTEKCLGYIDGQGKMVFTFPDDWQELWTGRFSEGLVSFKVKDKWGYFDRQGKVAVKPKYDDAKKFSEGLAAVNIGAKWGDVPRPRLMRRGKWGFIDRTGRLVIPLRFDGVDYKGFSDGLALVSVDDKSVYIDKAGRVVITLEYKSDDPKRFISTRCSFSEGLARIDTSGAHSGYSTGYIGFIDKTGKFAIEPRLDGAGDYFSEGLAAVRVGKRWGYMDRTARIVIKPRYEEAHEFSEGLAVVRKGEHRCYIDKQGKVVITGRFNDAEGFTGGLARVHEGGSFEIIVDGWAYWKRGAWFYINRKGEKVRRCRER